MDVLVQLEFSRFQQQGVCGSAREGSESLEFLDKSRVALDAAVEVFVGNGRVYRRRISAAFGFCISAIIGCHLTRWSGVGCMEIEVEEGRRIIGGCHLPPWIDFFMYLCIFVLRNNITKRRRHLHSG